MNQTPYNQAALMKRGVRSGRILVVVVVLTAVLAASFAPPAEAHHDPVNFPEFIRQDRIFGDLTLRTRGYLPEGCLLSPVVPCKASGSGKFKAEATAQARAIQALVSGFNPSNPALPLAAHGWDNVEWEVSQPPEPRCPEPPSNTIPPDPPAPCWRADIVVKSGLNPSLIEAKRWKGQISTQRDVNLQLDRYVRQADDYARSKDKDVRFDRNVELNAVHWSMPFLDTIGKVWCTWADEDLLNAGNVYFAPREETPREVADRTPGCDKDSEPQRASRTIELLQELADILNLSMSLDLAMRTFQNFPPTIIPSEQEAPAHSCLATYTVVVPKNPDGVANILMDYGDGGTSNSVTNLADPSAVPACHDTTSLKAANSVGIVGDFATIPQGSGFTTLTFSHVMPANSPRILTQSAIIFESGQSSNSSTYHEVSPVQADDESTVPALSGDGRRVAFLSLATNLASNSTANHELGYDVFVRDVASGTTTLVSADPTGGPANGRSSAPAISLDGRYVAFRSFATNLVPGDTNGMADTFVRDTAAGTTTRVSVTSGGAQGNASSLASTRSTNGRLVAFESFASNLVADDTNTTGDVFVRDLAAGTTTRVSVATSGAQGNGPSCGGALSADGRYLAFSSAATNLVADDTNGVRDIFLRDLDTGVTTRTSTSTAGSQANLGSNCGPSLSTDGRFLAFSSDATNLVSGDTNAATDVFVRDLATGTTTRESIGATGTEATTDSAGVSVSADGRYVVFETSATNLVADDTNGTQDVFVRDRTTGTTTRASVANTGQANGASLLGVISADGRYVGFASYASNLVFTDQNSTLDIFLRDQQGAGGGTNLVSIPGASGAAPAMPPSISTVPTDSAVTVSWTAPNPGGTPIEYYTVTANGPQAPDPEVVGASTPTPTVTFYGLENDTAYTFTVAATNGAGTGPGGTSAVTVPQAPPGGGGVEGRPVTTRPPAPQQIQGAVRIRETERRLGSLVVGCSPKRRPLAMSRPWCGRSGLLL